MAREFAIPFYNSKQWRDCRKVYRAKRRSIDGGMCERCREEPGLEVHHKIWLTPENINDVNISLNWDNLELLCEACHNREHFCKDDGFSFDENGDLIYTPPSQN